MIFFIRIIEFMALTAEKCPNFPMDREANDRKIKGFSILTWNINGIRASKTPLKQLLDGLNSDIICLQETKVTRDQLDEQTAIVDGYNSYFSFSKVRSGYSGVATFVRDHMTPTKAERGLTVAHSGEGLSGDQRIGCYGNQAAYFTEDELTSLDKEGRTVITEHTIRVKEKEKSLVIINVYCPRADPEKPDRLTFKLRFYQLLQLRAEELIKQGRHVIILGDMNTSHKKIDHCDPDNDEEFFLNPGRQWMDELLFNLDNLGSDPSVSVLEKHFNFETDISTRSASDGTSGNLETIVSTQSVSDATNDHHKFVDTFRLLYPTLVGAFTNWCTLTGARATNYGCRLDYVLADLELASAALRECAHMPEVHGSDHCPVRATLNCTVVPAKKCPPLCTRFMPEFSGRQQKLLSFMTRKVQTNASEIESSQTSKSEIKQIKPDANVETSEEIKNNCSFQQLEGECNDSFGSAECAFTDSSLSVELRLKVHNSNAATRAPLCKRNSGGGASQTKRAKLDSMPQGKLTNFLTKKDHPTVTLGGASTAPKQSNLLNFFSKGTQRNDSKVLDNDMKSHSTKSVKPDNGAEIQSRRLCAETDGAISGTQDLVVSSQTSAGNSANAWKTMLKGPPQAPLCSGHGEPCVLRDVKKDGPNKGKQFWVCNRPQGHKTNPAARCEHFTWVSASKR